MIEERMKALLTRHTIQLAGSFLAVVVFLGGASMSFAQTGKLKVTATPNQAYILVDGKAIKESSKGKVSLSPGEHTVDIYNYGYKPASQKVTIQPGKTTPLDVKLEAVPGNVEGPWGCITIEKAQRYAILLNGKTPDYFVGHGDEFDHNWWWKQELVVPAGTHQVTVLSEDKEVWSGSVNVPANQRVVLGVPDGVRKTVPWPRGEQFKTLPRFSAGTASATVAVAKPTAQISASKTQFNCGETTQLKWTATDSAQTTISDLGKVAPAGEKGVQPLQDTTYNMTASGPGGTATSSVKVAVNNAVEASLKVSPSEIRYHRVGDKVVEAANASLNWSTSNASAVRLEGVGPVEASGSRVIDATPKKNSPGPVDETTAYTLTATTCTGATETRTAKLHITGSVEPAAEEAKALEARLALHSIYFPTAEPTPQKPEGGLLESQQQTLSTLAADFKKYLEHKPDAHLALEGHADQRGSAEYNKALSERRVNRAKQYLVENGIPAESIELKGMGSQENLSADQVKQLVEQQANLSAPDKEKLLKDLPLITLAQNRRVDITLSTTGEQSVRQYPFNAADSLTLLSAKKSAAPAKKTAKTAEK